MAVEQSGLQRHTVVKYTPFKSRLYKCSWPEISLEARLPVQQLQATSYECETRISNMRSNSYFQVGLKCVAEWLCCIRKAWISMYRRYSWTQVISRWWWMWAIAKRFRTTCWYTPSRERQSNFISLEVFLWTVCPLVLPINGNTILDSRLDKVRLPAG